MYGTENNSRKVLSNEICATSSRAHKKCYCFSKIVSNFKTFMLPITQTKDFQDMKFVKAVEEPPRFSRKYQDGKRVRFLDTISTHPFPFIYFPHILSLSLHFFKFKVSEICRLPFRPPPMCAFLASWSV